MRWIPFIILAYLLVLVQTTVGKVLTFTSFSIGTVGPDLPALVAVFVALHVRSRADVMLAAWLLGLGLDLTAGGGPGGSAAIGPMPIAYALAAACLYQVREAFFRERALTQGLLAMGFCILAHGTWVTLQSLLAIRAMTWSAYGRVLMQAAALAVYTAALMPLAHWGLWRYQRWFITPPAGRRRR